MIFFLLDWTLKVRRGKKERRTLEEREKKVMWETLNPST